MYIRLLVSGMTHLFRTSPKFNCDVSTRVSDTNDDNSLVLVSGEILVVVRVNLFSLMSKIRARHRHNFLVITGQ